MAHQSEIPGMQDGMFFEYYVFEPRTNFTEKDLYFIVQFIDITFDDGNEPPHPEHFNGQIFSPKQGITVTEFADILTAMNIRVSDDILARLPEGLRTQFEDNVFCPFDDFGLDELVEFLTKFVHFRVNTGQFNSLPKRMKRQFIIFTRDGKHWRFGDRQPGA